MAYERQNFADGQVLTAECLNCIEDCLCDLDSAETILCTAQELTEEQKAQARENIGAASEDSCGNVDLSGYATEQWVVESAGYGNTRTGNPVHGEYIAGTDLKIKTDIEALQEDGVLVNGVIQNASPDNVREITGLNNVSITVSGEEPNSATTYNIELPDISFGGYVDLVRKKYIQTHRHVVITGANCGTPSSGGVTVSVGAAYKVDYTKAVLCNRYKGTTYTSDDNAAFAPSEVGLKVRDKTHFTDANATKAYLDANPVTVVYQLKTPIEHDIPNTPRCIAVDGKNTVSSNAKTLEVTGYEYQTSALSGVGNTLCGKIITCFGDSLAANCYVGDEKQWIERVGEYFKCKKVYNRGIGGSYVSLVNNNGVARNSYASVDDDGYAYKRIAYNTADRPTGIPADYTEINACMEGDERVNTIPIDTDVLLIEAGINDVGSLTAEKLAAAYERMLTKIQARVPDAKIIVLSFPFTHHQTFENDEGRASFRSQCEERMEAIRAVVKDYGLPIIEIRNTAQVNLMNWQTYMSNDGLHYDTVAGTKRWAETVISGMNGVTLLR